MDKSILKINIKKIIIVFLISSAWSVLLALVITGKLWQINNLSQNLGCLNVWLTINRAFLLFFVIFFVGIHFCFPVSEIYSIIFEKRWCLGLLLLVFLTLNRYHGDSISYYADVFQPGMGSVSSYPIFGEMRAVRVDEFVVVTPSVLASSYGENPYGKYNEVLRGTDTLNIIDGFQATISTLADAPWKFSYLILPLEYAFSFCWFSPLIFSFLVSIEFFYIVTKRKRLLSVAGAFLLIFSPFYMWWGFSTYFITAPGTIVCFYYFIEKKETWKKIVYGIGMSICFSGFIINLYPAWQVPIGWMFLAIGIWVVHDKWKKIIKFSKKEWGILGGCIIIVLCLVGSYFGICSEYIATITSTEYPGRRVSTGGFKLDKLFYYIQAPLYAYQDVGNASEASVFFSLFPVPTICAVYCWIKQKKKDWLVGGLLLVQIPMLLYITVGLPEFISVVLLFSHSVPNRTADIVGMIQIYLIVILLSRYSKEKKFAIIPALVIAVFVSGVACAISRWKFEGYLTLSEQIIMSIAVVVISVCLMVNITKKIERYLLILFIFISIFSSIYVRPLMKGLDAIYSKPIAYQIEMICQKDDEAKWLTYGGGHVLAGYSVACGAKTINSVQIYPNLALWEKLDEENKYGKIYNRYAHVIVGFTNQDTTFEKIQADCFKVNLSYKDIKKTEATYILASGELAINENDYVEFDKQYEEGGMSIYKIKYKQ